MGAGQALRGSSTWLGGVGLARYRMHEKRICKGKLCRPGGHAAHLLAVLVEHDEVGVVAIGGELDDLLEREAVALVVLRRWKQLLRRGTQISNMAV